MQRRQFAASLGILTAAILPTPLAMAQAGYPSKPVRLLVGVAPGGATDVLARIAAQKMGELLGQSFIVENRAGAGGTLAADVAAKAPADGYTLLASAPTVMVVAPHLYKKLGFDPLRDFTPVALLGGGPLVVVVHSDVPARNLAELIDLAKSRPGQMAFGSGGNGTASHLSAELFASAAGVMLLHAPYKGDGQGVNDLLGGQVQLMVTLLSLVEPHVKSGRLRLLAVTSKQRLPNLPHTPAVQETLLGYESFSWIGLYAPANTPNAVIQLLNAAWQKARKEPDVASKFEAQGMTYVNFNTPEEFAAFQRAEVGRWSKIITQAKVKPE